MDLFNYWSGRYEKGQTPWHNPKVHRFITDHTSDLDLSPPKRMFIPLCGRCQELMWFYEKGLDVVGLELIEDPVKQFFEENNLSFVVKDLPWAKLYKTNDERLKIYVCNIFDMDVSEVGKFDVVYDRGSLTVIDDADRVRYTQLMKSVLKEYFIYLLVTMQFDDRNTTVHVPKNISHDKTRELYGEWCNFKLLTTVDFYVAELPEILKTDKIEESFILLTPK